VVKKTVPSNAVFCHSFVDWNLPSFVICLLSKMPDPPLESGCQGQLQLSRQVPPWRWAGRLLATQPTLFKPPIQIDQRYQRYQENINENQEKNVDIKLISWEINEIWSNIDLRSIVFLFFAPRRSISRSDPGEPRRHPGAGACGACGTKGRTSHVRHVRHGSHVMWKLPAEIRQCFFNPKKSCYHC
jgi:hypothetical protein